MTTLSEFEGHNVVGTTIAVTNAGDGLSSALKVEPREYEHNETVHVVLECEVAKVRFDPSKDDPDDLIRVHVLRAGLATIVDEEQVRPMLAAQKKKLEEAEGVQQLDLDGSGGGQETSDTAA